VTHARGTCEPDTGLVDVPGGTITLRDEGSRRTWDVTVAPVRIGATPVTRALYRAVTGSLPLAVGSPPSDPPPPAAPVTDVSWLDAVAFCNRLSDLSGRRPCYRLGDDRDAVDAAWDRDADGYRLPTEAEWEHACRAGSTGVRYGELDRVAWYAATSGGRVHEVATREPNAWGLHDTLGNVWEWCWDAFDPEVYGPYRVFRGGGAFDPPRACRASCRRKSHPTFRIDDLGFRLARSR
jgi:formylglycine-generating enzyme